MRAWVGVFQNPYNPFFSIHFDLIPVFQDLRSGFGSDHGWNLAFTAEGKA